MNCICGHVDPFHVDELYPGGTAAHSPCMAEGCRCQGFLLCGHPKVEQQQNLGGTWDAVCTTCGAVIAATEGGND